MRRAIAFVTVTVIAAGAAAAGCGGSLATSDAGTDTGTFSDPCLAPVPVQSMPEAACRFVIPPPPCDIADRMHIGVRLNGTELARDPTHLNGWDYTDTTLNLFEIYGPGCDAITAGMPAVVEVKFKVLI